MGSLCRRLPVVVRAVLIGIVVALGGTLPWAWLVSVNIKHSPAVPWAVPPTGLYLWLYWRYLRGDGWPRSTAESRRVMLRGNRVPEELWGAALFAGVIGLTALMLFQRVLSRMVMLPQQRDIDPSRFPIMTVFLWVVMGSIVAGVVEEAAFRGYMQGPIERRHGPVLAMLITGTMFGFAHFSHPEVGLVLLPFYLGVAVVYGALAYLTDSILPGMVLHAGGNMLGALALFAGGTSEWQATTEPLIWQTGVDRSFVMSVVAMLVATAAAVWAYRWLGTVARGTLKPLKHGVSGGEGSKIIASDERRSR